MAKRIVDEEMRFSIIVNGDQAQKELIDLESSTRKLTQSNKDLRAEQARLVSQGKKGSEEYKRVTAEIKQNNIALKANKAQMKVLQNQIGITGLTMAQLSKRANQLRLELRHMVPGSAQYKKLEADLKAVSVRMTELRGNARATKTSIGGIADGFSRYAALGASVIAMTTGVVLSVQKMIDYNGKLSDAQSNVQKTTGLTKIEVDELSKSFGAFKTRTARIELLELAEEAGRLGITGTKNIKDFVEVGNQLKVALGDDLSSEAIREVGKLSNIYKVGERTGRDFKNSLLSIGSAINEVSASGANTADFLVDYLKRQAGVAVQTKISAEDNIGYAATFDELGQSVEVSATAMNKIWIDMYSNSEAYAKIAGVGIKEFTHLLNTDANQAMKLFLKGLNGNEEGLTVMIEKMEDLEAGGARGVQALLALASNTELLEKRQLTANKALGEATSLTNEYELKNNNLAATIDKVKKTMIGMFSSETIINGLSTVIGKFALLIGAVEDVDEAFSKQTKVSGALAVSNRKLANESSNLLAEYEMLAKDGVEPTTEAKQRMDEIVLLLKDHLGESVVEINKETGALTLNSEAVREQIKLKRLSADAEASTLVSRLQGTKDEEARLNKLLPELQKEYEARKRIADAARPGYHSGNKFSTGAGYNRATFEQSTDEGKKEVEAANKLARAKEAIAEQEKRRLELVRKLKDLNFTEADADNFFKDSPSEEPTIADPIIPGPTYTPKAPSSNTRDNAKKRADDLLKLQRETEDRMLELKKESFDKEMLMEDFNHYRKIEDLQDKLISEETIRKATDKNMKDSYLANNAAINSQIESENELHEIRKSTILEKGIITDIELKNEQYEREKTERQTAHNNELAALGENDKAKKKLQKQFDEQELTIEKAHLETLTAELKQIIDSGGFEGFDLKLLSDEQLQKIKDNLAELGLSISEINTLLAAMGGGTDVDGLGVAGEVDILGFSLENWESTFSNLEEVENKIRAAQMAVQAFTNAWGMYNDFVSGNQKKELQEFERTTDKKKQRQKQLLDSGYINERQYNESIKAMDSELDRRKAEMEYKAAKREKAVAMSNVAMNTALAIMSIWAQVPKFDFGISAGILSGIVGGLGAIQMGIIAAQPLPAKGFEDGYYNVQREQDGKLFNAAYGGESRTGLVDKPTLFLAGEGGRNFPEMIIDGASFKQMNPDVKQALYGELARVKGYERGYVQNQTADVQYNNTTSTATPTDPLLLSTLVSVKELLEKLDKNGIDAYMDKSFRNLKKLREELDKYDKLKEKNRR